ncbi:4Fe-4S dicluster domain-containing protein [Alphaproteobacteria bacterium GH1-50]|uniref:4Fe-4S dicluster domain-containing protein n=1 Tax=Kangsaoukella pontilimi TaxID=2691042 RepID=A0A7C9MUR0_9RHOB|nr:4Fe-4S binding protein [Kangsaoukella pontilimi]MXQ06334.1 4Fe-4S dicluster domain-containing protein [Kangsaoukella pontilimi]
MAKIERVILCSCESTMETDPESASAALAGASVLRATRACTGDTDVAAKALAEDGTTLIACGQMAGFFEELADELGAGDRLATADIRDRAGWTADGRAFAKQAALLAEAALPRPATPLRDIDSSGTCLILGAPDVVLDAAEVLSDTLAVTALLDSAPDDMVPTDLFDVALGRLKSASGSLGRFEVVVDGYRQMLPGGRGAARFGDAADGARSGCDIILDLRGQGPLFPADHKRDGYVRADPGDPRRVQTAIAEARDLQGTFEKPIYIRYDASICAHSRASQQGCDRCLTVCPTGAIVPAGDHVSIDPDICAGCGACAAVCPSGAASYDDPPVSHLFARLRTLASAYRKAGGSGAPRVLFHDAEHGAELIRLSARFGRGLPADVIPVEVPNIEGVGHAELLAALGVGFATATVLAGPRSDLSVPNREIALANAILENDTQISLVEPAEPDALEAALYDEGPAAPLDAEPILPLGGRREVTRIAAAAMTKSETPIPLPDGAPYGAIAVDTDACTLCLACVSLCPVGALGDSADRPQLRFQEAACLQCGICASTCPENAISLVPQLDTSKAALEFRVLNEEEPFECIECGKAFGVRSTIERIVEKLSGQHWMYTNSDNTRLIQMCDDCRITAQYHQEASPFRMGDRPRVRTTEDEIAERDKN